MEEVTCIRCNYKWYSRVPNPRACPRCKSFYWNIPRIRPQRKMKGENNGR
jgi:hypothetical protein